MDRKNPGAPQKVPAGALYAGGDLGSRSGGKLAEAKFYILSAGLGLVAAGQRVPVYGLTVSGGHAKSVAARSKANSTAPPGLPDCCRSAFRTLGRRRGPGFRACARRTDPALCGDGGRELQLIWTRQVLARLRIFGASLAPALAGNAAVRRLLPTMKGWTRSSPAPVPTSPNGRCSILSGRSGSTR